MHENLPPIRIRRLRKFDQIKEYETKEKLIKENYHWNNWKFQLNLNKLVWVYPKTQNCNNNPFCSSNHKLYIKYGKQICHFLDFQN